MFYNLKPHKHIALHQIHQIMFFLTTSYDHFKIYFNQILILFGLSSDGLFEVINWAISLIANRLFAREQLNLRHDERFSDHTSSRKLHNHWKWSDLPLISWVGMLWYINISFIYLSIIINIHYSYKKYQRSFEEQSKSHMVIIIYLCGFMSSSVNMSVSVDTGLADFLMII